MGKPKKRKGKIRVSQKARVRKKSEQPKDTIQKDTIQKAPAKVYPENAAHIKIKIRKK